jgi:hypothetical protein
MFHVVFLLVAWRSKLNEQIIYLFGGYHRDPGMREVHSNKRTICTLISYGQKFNSAKSGTVAADPPHKLMIT